MILSATTQALQIVLGGAVTTNQVRCMASYVDHTTTTVAPGCTIVNSNNTTDVAIVPAPAASTQRQIKHIILHNLDTVAVTLTVKVDVSATDTILLVQALSPGQSLEWTEESGWKITPDTNVSLAGTMIGQVGDATVVAAMGTIDLDTNEFSGTESPVGEFNVAVKPGGFIGSGAFASRPAAAKAGKLYYSTDAGMWSRDTGAAWENFGDRGLWTPPPTSGWTETTMGTAAFTDNNDSSLLTIPRAVGENWRIRYKTLAVATPYTVTAYFDWGIRDTGNGFGGLCLLNATPAIISYGDCYDGDNKFHLTKWTNPTTYSADYQRTPISLDIPTIPNWIRIRDDGTNRITEYSFNGLDWLLMHTIGRTDFITPTRIGWGGNYQGVLGTIPNLIRLRSWVEA